MFLKVFIADLILPVLGGTTLAGGPLGVLHNDIYCRGVSLLLEDTYA